MRVRASPVGGVPREPGPGVGIDEKEVLLPHLLFDGVGLHAAETVQGLLKVRVDGELGRAVEPLQLMWLLLLLLFQRLVRGSVRVFK